VGTRTITTLAVALAIAAGTLTANASSQISAPNVDRHCHKVGLVTMKLLASGLNRGRRFVGTGYAVRSGIPPTSHSLGKSYWFLAARIRGRGVGVWATTLSPSLRRKPPGGTGNILQAANAVAWRNSQWGVLGSFPKNYPLYPPGEPPLDNPGLSRAVVCVR
jgi:hypothetical protein